MATTDIRNILYKSIEQEVSSGTNFKLFSVDNTNAYTIRVYIDSSGNKFSFEVNNDSDGTNYKIENYAINQNITIYKNKSSDSDIYYVKFANNTAFTIRKEIIYGYLTDANTVGTAVAGTPIATLTTSSPKHIFAGNSAFIGNSTVTGDVDFNGGFTAEKDVNLTGNINFHNFYIDDFINTPGTVPDGASKITFKDSDETLDIYGIYNEILQPIKVDNSVYQGKITILVSISNATLSESTQGAAELILLELVGTSQPEQKYQVVYIQSSSSIEIRSIKSNNKEVLSTIMIGGNYIINTVTIPFANNISCKVTNVYLKEEGSAITIYKVADKIIGGGESDSDASHYLLTAQSLSQILTLSSLSAGATTTNLTKNPDSTFNYDSDKNYLIYQTGSNTTNLYLTNDDSNERYIYSQNRQVKNRIGTTASTANTIVIRDNNNNINTGSLTASSVNAEGLDNAGKIIVSGDTSTGTLSITGKLTSGATTVTGASELASLIANGNVTVTGTSQLKSQFIANGNVTVTGTANLGDNPSDQINFNAATTVKGTANFKSTLNANGSAEVTGKATLSSLTANGGVDVNGTANLGDNPSDQINFNAATTVNGTANLASLIANGNVTVTGTANLGDAASDNINFNATTTIKGTAFVNGRINFGQVNESDAASIYATNDSTTSGIIFSIADDNDDYFAFRSSHWENGAKDILKLTYSNITAASNIIPLSSNTYNIGSTSNKWQNLYVNNIVGALSTSLVIKGNGTDAATYNGSVGREVNIVAGTSISVTGNTNGTITIAHSNHASANITPGWSGHQLVIPKLISDSQGHITSNETSTIDLSKHYLRCDASDTMSSVLTITGPHLDTSNGLLSAPDGSLTLGVGQGRIYGNAIGFTCPGVSTDAGRMRVLGTGEADTVLELATGDDGGGGESIHFRGYTTSGAIGYDVTVPKENGTILTTSSAKIEKTSDELFSITINGKTITFKQTGGEGSPLEITCS